MMSIKSVNALTHDTDWTIAHVHAGALGWVAMITIGVLYSMIPRIYGKSGMYSKALINVHFWLSTVGIVLYISAMWTAGLMQGLMWRAFNTDGTLTYTFVESLQATHPYYIVRAFGGLVFLVGMLLMAYNVWRTLAEESEAAPSAVAEPAGA
jgi:cytochrome c oxidase cbb3-type subunit 1